MISDELTVRFTADDFTLNGCLKPSSLQQVFQDIAQQHSAREGFGYRDMLQENLIWIITKLRYQVLFHPEPNTDYRLVTFPKPKKGMLYFRDFYLYDAEGNLYVRAISQWCVMDYSSRRLVRYPRDFQGEFTQDSAIPEGFLRFTPDELTPAGEYHITEKDLDGNNHTNNCRYGDMVLQVLPDHIGNELSITFSKETRLGDTIELFTSPSDAGLIVCGKKDGELIFSALT